MTITLRPFLPSDASGEGDIGDESIIGLTVEIGGAVAAYAGIRQVLGHNWAFFKLLDERARRPALMHRTTLAVLDAAERCGVTPVFTFCDESASPRAEAWLQRLGFRPLADHEKDADIRATEEIVGHDTWIRGGR